MYEWLRRHKGAIIFALSIIAITLAFANAWKHQILSVKWLKDQKDALAAFKDIVTLLILLAASVFSYYRFFRGRTLSLRADLDIDISVHDTPNEYNLHAYTIHAKNVGTSTIWNPKPYLRVIVHGPDDADSERKIEHWYEEETELPKGSKAPVIEADEKATFFGHQEIPKSAWAVTYLATIKADSGDSWFVSRTISNKEKA